MQSGTRVLKGHFRLRTEGVGPDATLGQMLAIMDQGLEDAVRIGADGKPEGSKRRHPGASAWKRFKLFLLKPLAPFIKRQL